LSVNELKYLFKDDFWVYFPIMSAENAVNYGSYGVWTSLKNVLMPLNVTDFLKVNGIKR
jgi:hypothetical protein